MQFTVPAGTVLSYNDSASLDSISVVMQGCPSPTPRVPELAPLPSAASPRVPNCLFSNTVVVRLVCGCVDPLDVCNHHC